MQDILRLILHYLSGIWRFRWVALLIGAVASPVGWFYVATLPDQYVASARVFVDTDSVLNELLQGLAIQTDDTRRVSMMTRVLFSNENMKKLARMTDMDLRAKTPQQMDALVNSLKSRVSLSGRRDNIYTISFEDTSPELAKRVVQSMLTIFVESNLGTARQDQDSAEQFLQREIKEYERRMIEAERKLKDFKMRNLDFVTEKGNYYQRLKSAKDAHEAAKAELALATKFRDEVQGQLAEVQQESADAVNQQYKEWIEEAAKSVTAPHDERIAQLESQVDDLLLKYTELHPEVIALRGTLERVKARRAADRAEFLALQDTESVKAGFAESPLYQEMRLRLSAADVDVATQQGRVENLGLQIQELQRAVDHVLQIEAEQGQLNRDYGILQSNHQTLLARLERARLTRQVDTSVDTVRFRTLDPPRVPEKPSGPNRILMSSMAFGGSLVVGIGVALLLSMLRPVFEDRRQLNEAMGIPVLGSVNMIWTARQRQKRRMVNLAFGLGFFGLLISFGLVMAAFYLDINLLSRLAA